MCAKQTGKIYYSMGEVTEMFDVNPSLIRFWESKFDVLKPHKNKKGNRMFTPADVENLKLIYHLVKEKGMTLEGARKMIKSNREGINRDLEVIDRLLGIKALLSEIKQELSVGADFESDPDEEYIPDSTTISATTVTTDIEPEPAGLVEEVISEDTSYATVEVETLAVHPDSGDEDSKPSAEPEPAAAQETTVTDAVASAASEVTPAENEDTDAVQTVGGTESPTEQTWPEDIQGAGADAELPSGEEFRADEVFAQPEPDTQEDAAGFAFASDELDMIPDDFGFTEDVPDDAYIDHEPLSGEDITAPESTPESVLTVADKPISEQVQQIVSQNITEIAGEELPEEYIEQLSDEIAEEAATAAEVMEALAELDKAEEKKQGPTVYEQTLF